MLRLNPITVASLAVISSLCTGVSQAEQKDPYLQPDDTWISINGTVDAVTSDSFVLDYGNGSITVEMDDGDRDADGYKLLAGDKVTVNGMIDDDFFETTTIEASSVYVEKLDTYFYASAVDEEDYRDVTIFYTAPLITGQTMVQGTVSKVEGDEFVVNTGFRSVTVDVDQMAYNPLDDEGYQKIEPGDVVRVTGTVDDDLLEKKEIKANTVVTLME